MVGGARAASCIAARAAICFDGASTFGAAEAHEEEAFSQGDEESRRREPPVLGARSNDFEGTNLTTDGGRGGAFEADTREYPGDGGGVIGAPREDAARYDEENG